MLRGASLNERHVDPRAAAFESQRRDQANSRAALATQQLWELCLSITEPPPQELLRVAPKDALYISKMEKRNQKRTARLNWKMEQLKRIQRERHTTERQVKALHFAFQVLNHVRAGANVLYEVDNFSDADSSEEDDIEPDEPMGGYEEHHSILLRFLDSGELECALACLETELPLDFSVQHEGKESAVMFMACSADVFSREESKALIQAIVQHLERHPEDVAPNFVADAQDPNNEGHFKLEWDFITVIALEQRLSLLYPLVRHLPVFADRTVPIQLPEDGVWSWDWECLSESEKQDFYIPEDLIVASRSTAELSELSGSKEIDEKKLTEYVMAGADVMFNHKSFGRSLFRILRHCNATALPRVWNICLNSPNAIRWGSIQETDFSNETILFLLCHHSLPDWVTTQLLKAFTKRLRRVWGGRTTAPTPSAHHSRPMDEVNWHWLNSNNEHFLSIAARAQKLMLVLRELMPFLLASGKTSPRAESERGNSNAQRPFAELRCVWRKDWIALHSAQWHHYFDFKYGEDSIVNVSDATAAICQWIDRETRGPQEVQELRRHLKAKGNQLYYPLKLHDNTRLLHHLFRLRRVEVVQAVLDVVPSIDFTVMDSINSSFWRDPCSLMQCLVWGAPPYPGAGEVWRMVARRLCKHRGRGANKIDWSLKDLKGKTLFSTAARSQCLALVWHSLKRAGSAAPSIVEARRTPYTITCPVCQWDWKLLAPDDQACFQLQRGFASDHDDFYYESEEEEEGGFYEDDSDSYNGVYISD